MPVPNYHIEAIDSCRAKLEGLRGKFPQAADGVPEQVSGEIFGGLPSSGAISAAVSGVVSNVRGEFEAAGTRSGEIAAALDKVTTAVQESEEINAEMLRLDNR